MSLEQVVYWLGVATVLSPASLVAAVGLPPLLGLRTSEGPIVRCTQWATLPGILSALGVLAVMLIVGDRHVPIELGHWVVIPQEHFHFHLKFVFDRLSVPLVLLSFLLCGTVSAFASRYLHREPGFRRFYVCYSLFLLGMVVSSLAGTIEVLFFGWELVGLSSALLIAFYHERRAPVQNGLRVWSVYRLSDAAFLVAAVALHHFTGAGDFDAMMGEGSWPERVAELTSNEALLVGLLLLVAAAGKSALVPFSGWLPRAMEGPTPSSAIFYGALSVHLGAFLLLRVSPLIERSPLLGVAVVAVGLVTALFASLVARVQTDIKSVLAFASLTQVGIIVAEIGLGLQYVALVHLLGHACLRTLQLLRAPTLLHDYQTLEKAIGGNLQDDPGPLARWLPSATRLGVYRFAMDRGYLDNLLDDYVVEPFKNCFRFCDRLERRWTDWLTGGNSRESDAIRVHDEIVEELRL